MIPCRQLNGTYYMCSELEENASLGFPYFPGLALRAPQLAFFYPIVMRCCLPALKLIETHEQVTLLKTVLITVLPILIECYS